MTYITLNENMYVFTIFLINLSLLIFFSLLVSVFCNKSGFRFSDYFIFTWNPWKFLFSLKRYNIQLCYKYVGLQFINLHLEPKYQFRFLFSLDDLRSLLRYKCSSFQAITFYVLFRSTTYQQLLFLKFWVNIVHQNIF